MSLWPACAGTPQRMKTPPIPQPWGEQHTPRIGGRGAIFKGDLSPKLRYAWLFPLPVSGRGGCPTK